MKKQVKHLYQHYDTSEYDFIDKLSNIIYSVETSYAIYVTDFVNPRQEEIAHDLVAQTALTLYSSRGLLTEEYHRLIIAPDYYQLNLDDFEISLVEICYAKKFNRLTHSQIMGTLINQLGIKRSVFGDILVNGSDAQICLKQSMVTYFEMTVHKIAKVPVKLREIPLDQKVAVLEEGDEQLYLVSSLRLDKVLAAVYQLSRQLSQNLIQSQKTKLNHKPTTKTTETVAVNDLLSVRGYGRCRIIALAGVTSKGKYKLVVKKIRQK
ncbi:RNA-binding protein [Streptococcus pluranimalium]|uniref:YlmH family RNA-binding protein n=1 Tax=Streptococcus pluranimalium TaxID=82348 RepID=UPI0039FC6589